jgi:hypothetical protein
MHIRFVETDGMRHNAWLLQPSRFQRRALVGIEGDNGSGRTSSVARAPPWWQAQ